MPRAIGAVELRATRALFLGFSWVSHSPGERPRTASLRRR